VDELEPDATSHRHRLGRSTSGADKSKARRLQCRAQGAGLRCLSVRLFEQVQVTVSLPVLVAVPFFVVTLIFPLFALDESVATIFDGERTL